MEIVIFVIGAIIYGIAKINEEARKQKLEEDYKKSIIEMQKHLKDIAQNSTTQNPPTSTNENATR